MQTMKGRIFEIKRFAVHDGDGIRTTVFFKGCPLRCVWCHNPEGLVEKPQLAYYEHKCIGCGACASVCPAGAHSMLSGFHAFDREKCTFCGNCVSACLGNALTFYGKPVTVTELMPKLLEDKEFYETSGGGVTLSGGECLLQADFCAELLKELKREDIHTAVDTCGFIPRESINKVMPYTDVFLYDVKAFDEDVHVTCTGQSGKLILENLQYIDSCGKQIEIRIPYVPQYNHEQMQKIASYIGTLRHVTKVRILPYHNYAGSKYTSLGLQNSLPKRLPTEAEIKAVEALFCKK